MSRKNTALPTSFPVYLLVADETEEFMAALRYAARAALDNGARLAVLHVMEREEFQQWGEVQKLMDAEHRAEAEKILLAACDEIMTIAAQVPSVYLQKGSRMDAVVEVINTDPSITKLILGAGIKGSSPGPLVSYFTGKGLSKLRVPLTIVPEHLMERAAQEDI